MRRNKQDEMLDLLNVHLTRNGESIPQPPLPGPKYLALAAQHPDAAEALAIIGKAEPNWAELYKVYEIVRDNISQPR